MELTKDGVPVVKEWRTILHYVIGFLSGNSNLPVRLLSKELNFFYAFFNYISPPFEQGEICRFIGIALWRGWRFCRRLGRTSGGGTLIRGRVLVCFSKGCKSLAAVCNNFLIGSHPLAHVELHYRFITAIELYK